MLYGPQHAGKSTQAQLLSRVFRFPVVRLDEVLEKTKSIPPSPGFKVSDALLADAFYQRYPSSPPLTYRTDTSLQIERA